MQVSSVARVPISEFWAAGSAPLLEIIPDADPFKPRECWEELRNQLGNRVSTEIVTDACHALFPEQPDRIADVVIAWCQRLMSDGQKERSETSALARHFADGRYDAFFNQFNASAQCAVNSGDSIRNSGVIAAAESSERTCSNTRSPRKQKPYPRASEALDS